MDNPEDFDLLVFLSFENLDLNPKSFAENTHTKKDVWSVLVQEFWPSSERPVLPLYVGGM